MLHTQQEIMWHNRKKRPARTCIQLHIFAKNNYKSCLFSSFQVFIEATHTYPPEQMILPIPNLPIGSKTHSRTKDDTTVPNSKILAKESGFVYFAKFRIRYFPTFSLFTKMKLILVVVSIMTLWSSSLAAFVLHRPPGLDKFFLQLQSEMDPMEVIDTDPIREMDQAQRTSLCTDVKTAKLFLTPGEHDIPLPDPNFKHSYPVDGIQDYKHIPVLVANTQVVINLLNCPKHPGIYISYGYTDHYYFMFTKAKDRAGIRLLAIVEPNPTLLSSFQDEELLQSAFWKDTHYVQLTTWEEKIEKFRLMSKGQQFRLCGLAYSQWIGTDETANSYEITLPNDPDEGPLSLKPYGIFKSGILFHLSPALICKIRAADESTEQEREFLVIPNASDDHSVYLTKLHKSKQLMGVQMLKLTHYLTKVSSQYGNQERFQEPQPSSILQSLMKGLYLAPSKLPINV